MNRNKSAKDVQEGLSAPAKKRAEAMYEVVSSLGDEELKKMIALESIKRAGELIKKNGNWFNEFKKWLNLIKPSAPTSAVKFMEGMLIDPRIQTMNLSDVIKFFDDLEGMGNLEESLRSMKPFEKGDWESIMDCASQMKQSLSYEESSKMFLDAMKPLAKAAKGTAMESDFYFQGELSIFKNKKTTEIADSDKTKLTSVLRSGEVNFLGVALWMAMCPAETAHWELFLEKYEIHTYARVVLKHEGPFFNQDEINLQIEKSTTRLIADKCILPTAAELRKLMEASPIYQKLSNEMALSYAKDLKLDGEYREHFLKITKVDVLLAILEDKVFLKHFHEAIKAMK